MNRIYIFIGTLMLLFSAFSCSGQMVDIAIHEDGQIDIGSSAHIRFLAAPDEVEEIMGKEYRKDEFPGGFFYSYDQEGYSFSFWSNKLDLLALRFLDKKPGEDVYSRTSIGTVTILDDFQFCSTDQVDDIIKKLEHLGYYYRMVKDKKDYKQLQITLSDGDIIYIKFLYDSKENRFVLFKIEYYIP